MPVMRATLLMGNCWSFSPAPEFLGNEMLEHTIRIAKEEETAPPLNLPLLKLITQLLMTQWQRLMSVLLCRDCCIYTHAAASARSYVKARTAVPWPPFQGW